MTGVPAWQVHLAMPMCGARMVDGRVDAIIELARKDPLMAFLAPFAHQAADEFPAALAALRDQLPVDDEPIGILGGSLGGAVALKVLTTGRTPIKAAALVNPAVRIRSVVELVGPQMTGSGHAYPWTPKPAGPPTSWTSSPAPARSRRNLRCCSSAASWTIRRYGRTRPSWSTRCAGGMRTRTRSS
jgi:pimeloyl-ACP methyl ester carboxylesterase